MLISITDWWTALSGIEQLFWGIGIVAGVLFVLQFVLSLFGLDFDSDTDVDVSGGDYSLDPSFTLFTSRSIIAFFTFFGWFGVIGLIQDYPRWMVFAIATGAGLAALLLVAYLMYFFYKLSESGTANLKELIYKDATVYLTIPGRRKGQGKVHVMLGKAIKELQAVTEGEALANGSKVKIVDIVDDNVLVVESAEVFEPK